ncbi:Flavin-containing monooxygenase family protein [Perilla frutescens var. hirtella]|uniref:Flavin-containing monooxygenase n=1 Tax=Perilla frutescens var. hirtella TaxID=608512 RepID=A0AAD4P0L2_PERFH|nr:Flavin-containing monooxygenase family protein [Perilla frutescens var. hirtella]
MDKATEAAVTIVGSGPSGLATAAYLHHLSIPYRLLEREECFASLWQKYAYDRVHLHLAKQFCQLPLMPFPAAYPTYVSRQQFVHYLNDYVSHFDIRPTYRRSVERAAYDSAAGEWRIEARNLDSGEVEEYRSRFLVVATGETCDARIPEVEGLGSFNGEVLHSTVYRNGEKFAGKTVLVVGSGNSGMEIALDLANSGAKTSIVVRSPIHVLSRAITYVSQVLIRHIPLNWVDSVATMMSKIVYGDLTKYGIKRPKEGPFALKVKYGKYPVVDVGTFDKIKSGEIQVLPGIRSIKGNNVLFENGEEHAYDAVVFATGFKRPTKQWLKGDDYLLNEDGLPQPSFPNHWKGKNGLYCAGLARRGLWGASMDAQNIAQDVKTFFI